MFTTHDILDIAIQLEKNGERTYLQAVERMSNEELKDLLHWAAGEEKKHARWFSGLKEGLTKGEDHDLMADMSRALVEDVIQRQAFSLEEVDFSFIESSEELIRIFIGFEEDTIAFYEVIRAFIQDSTVVEQLNLIIEEERNHIAQFQRQLKRS